MLVKLLEEKSSSILSLSEQMKLSEEELRGILFDLELEGKVFVRADIVSLN